MNIRERRGLAIAETFRIVNTDGVMTVPSQSGNGKYRVTVKNGISHCTCPDHETRGLKCKHIYAVDFLDRGYGPEEGSARREPAPLAEKRRTYPQNWPAYNRAQVSEKAEFQRLLHELCAGIPQPPQVMGRPRLLLADAIFSAAFKVYSTFSGRRFMTDLTGAFQAGFISKLPCYNSIFRILESEETTPLLQSLITQSSLPLKEVEVDFALDSSGFTTSRFVRWFDKKYNTVRAEHRWIKAHVMTGVKTNIVTCAEVSDEDGADSPFMPPLVRKTAEHFAIRDVSCDKGFSTVENHEVVAEVGGTPFIAFKTVATGGSGGLWEKMFHYFSFRREEFLGHYHKRSNVESTFSMVKAKFRDHVRSKTETAMKNEVLCKFLCHNICCLISAIHELGIEVEF